MTKAKYILLGKKLNILSTKVKDLGKCISKVFLFTKPSYIFSAAYSVVFKKGILKSFLSVIGVLIKPGETKQTRTFDLLKSKYKLSAKLFRADFEGPYPVEFGKPL